MDEPLIRDIPSIKKTLDDMRNFSSLKKVFPLFRPFLKLLGIDVVKLDNAFSNFDDPSQKAEELAAIPDKFNDLFAPQGWIIYDLMNVEVAKEAIKLAESGDYEKAELHLANYYNIDTVRWKLQTMNAVDVFRPRMLLAKKALTDYEEERYHACVPVVLALLDGLVNELHERRRGFFSEDIDLSAWDSVAGHSKGLNVLATIFQKGRYKTTTEHITIPYRNGILHGMDLGYDNKMVAAKTWAALFSARDWAIKAEKGLINAPPEQPEKTWSDIFQQMKETAADKELIEQWEAREVKVGVDIPETGTSDMFENDSPEEKLAEYLTLWKAKNYGYMARCLSPIFGPPVKKAPAQIRDVFQCKTLKSFVFKEVSDEAAAITEIKTDLLYEEDGKEVNKAVGFRLVYIESDGNPEIRGKPNCQWAIVNWAVY